MDFSTAAASFEDHHDGVILDQIQKYFILKTSSSSGETFFRMQLLVHKARDGGQLLFPTTTTLAFYAAGINLAKLQQETWSCWP